MNTYMVFQMSSSGKTSPGSFPFSYMKRRRGGHSRGYRPPYNIPNLFTLEKAVPFLAIPFLGLGALLGEFDSIFTGPMTLHYAYPFQGFARSNFIFDGESNNFRFNPNITYGGDNQTLNIFDQDTFTNTQLQQDTNTITNTQTTTNENAFTSTVIPVSLNGDGESTSGSHVTPFFISCCFEILLQTLAYLPSSGR